MNIAWLSRDAATAERNRRRMQMTGLTPNGYRLWDHFEQSELSGHYPDYNAALRIIVRRTRPAAHSKASRMGITRPRGRPWDYNEITRLRRMFPSANKAELLNAFPGRTWGAITSAAHKRHIYRQPRSFVPSGDPLIDQILARAQQMKWSLRDLDAVCGRRGFFSERRWRSKGRARTLALAVRALGGHLRAKWNNPISASLKVKADRHGSP